MASYYTAIIVVSWMALGILCILVHENSWIPQADKHLFYLTYAVIAASALAEWCGVQLSGSDGFPSWMLQVVKCADYVLTPTVGVMVVAQMKLHNAIFKALVGLLAFNVIFQIIAAFCGWMITIDSGNHYVHGPLYGIYMAVYLLVIVLTIVEFLIYGTAFRKQNRASVYAVMVLAIVGVGLQEVLGREYRTAYISLTLCVALMFIHYSEFYQMTTDDHIKRQQSQIMQDALTGVFSRHAYTKALKDYGDMEALPEDLAAFTIDINGLKTVNDTIGHDAGDELIIGAARCIERAFGEAGRCFRTGGDEFVVFARMDREQADAVLLRLDRETRLWSGEAVKSLGLSSGCALAADHSGITAEKLVKEADIKMYAAKAEYYKTTGQDRRGQS